MQHALTDTLIRNLRPPAVGRLEITDVRLAGLAFRITAGGARSWCFRFRDPRSGKTTRATLGSYPDLSLSDARTKAAAMRKQVARGENPVEAKRRERETAATKTFQALGARYMAEHARRHKRSADADERNLRLHILPKWGKRRFDEITRADAIDLVEAILRDGKPTLANRVQALLSKVFNFAVDASILSGNPITRMRRRGAETIGRRVLTDDEIGFFWRAAVRRPVSERVGLVLRLILLTGVRPNEAAGIARTELEHLDNPSKARWIIPATRSKNGLPHLVPLSKQALTVIAAAADLAKENAFLFPSPTVGDAPITGHALAVAMSRIKWSADAPTPRDLRRTVRTRLAELRIPEEVRDAIQNHSPRTVGKRHYELYDFAAEKRLALDAWGVALDEILETDAPSAHLPLQSGHEFMEQHGL